MLKTTFKISLAVALLTIGSMADNGQKGHGKNHNNQEMQEKSQNNNTQINNIELSNTQKEGLTFMAEEEKVARDVYIYLADKWGNRVFSNIAKSEQRHMDAIERLLNSYQLPVPSTMDEEGIFIDEKLQAMYDALIEKGDKSLTDALQVGVEIEETDIDDLETLLNDANIPSNVAQVYDNLLKGSYNHLNSFKRRL
jgi:hypothetical protein